MSTETKTAPLPVPDNAPSVVFDIRLGEQLDHVDFDYPAYMKHLEDRGLTSNQIAEGSIAFEPKRGSYSGMYIPDGNRIVVGLSKNPRQKELNKVLAHETQHRIDDAEGNLDGAVSVLNRTVRPLKYGGWTATLGSFPMQLAAFNIESAKLLNISGKAALGGLVMQIASAGIYRFGLKPERNARKAEKSALPVIKIARK